MRFLPNISAGKLQTSSVALVSGFTLLTVTVLAEGLTFGFEYLKPVNFVIPFLCGNFFGLIISRLLQSRIQHYRDEADSKVDAISRNLQDAEERFHQYSETSKDWFWETDEEHRLVFFSSHFYQTMGVSSELVIGKTREQIRSHDPDPEEKTEWDRYLRQLSMLEPFEDFQYQIKRQSGENLIIRVSGKPFFARDGSFRGYRGTGVDVTDELMVIDRLRRTQELIYQATAVLSDGFVLFDADYRLVMCNQRFREIYRDIEDKLEPGITYSEIVETSADELMTFANDEEKQAWKSLQLAKTDEKPLPIDQRLNTGQWIRIIEQPLPDGGLVGLRIDVTEIKRIDEELMNAQRIAQIGSWRWDVVNDRLISCSPEYAAIHGVSMDQVEDLMRHQIDKVIHLDDRERVEHEFAQFDKENRNYEIEYRILRGDGEIRHVIERGEPSKVANTEIIEQMGTVQDVTDRKRAEEERAKGEQLLEGAIENIPGGFILIDADGNIDRFNRKFYDLYPLLQNHISIGKPFREFLFKGALANVYVNETDDVDAWVEECITQLEFDTDEQYDQLNDGRWIRIARKKLADGSVVGIHLDVTELQEARRAAEEANNAKTVFLASMSHELRTPMHGILSFAELGLSRIEKLDKLQMTKYLNNILTSANRLMFLINDLLDLSRMQSGNMKLHKGDIDLANLIETCLNEQLIQMQDKHQHYWFDRGFSGLNTYCDQHRMFQAISNIVSNAIKFSPAKSEIKISLSLVENRVRLTVSDKGVGIPETQLENVFERFYQADNNESKIVGTGLGLAICREIIELHDGKIWAENNEGKGSSIIFEIPMRDQKLQSTEALVLVNH